MGEITCPHCGKPLENGVCVFRLPQKPLELGAIRRLAVVWLEDFDKQRVIPAFVDHVSLEYSWFKKKDSRSIVASHENYGKRWRAWEHEPTDEERKAAAWES